VWHFAAAVARGESAAGTSGGHLPVDHTSAAAQQRTNAGRNQPTYGAPRPQALRPHRHPLPLPPALRVATGRALLQPSSANPAGLSQPKRAGAA